MRGLGQGLLQRHVGIQLARGALQWPAIKPSGNLAARTSTVSLSRHTALGEGIEDHGHGALGHARVFTVLYNAYDL